MEEKHIDESIKPGQYLAYEREKKGFTVDDIANKLYLSPHIIYALEEDAHDKLPELVYVRGYIRSYCRLLRIDPVPVLEMYTKNLPEEEDHLLEDLAPTSPINERQQRLIIFWGSIAIVTIFFILVIGWWQEKQPVTINVNKPLTTQDDLIEQPRVIDPNISDTPPKQVEVPAGSEAETIPTESALEQDINRVESDIEAELNEQTSPPVLTPLEIEIKEVSEEDVPPETAPPPITPDDTDTSQLVTLVVMASGDSWARVRDGSGEIIIHRILPNNYNKIFMVNLPLKFEFGNAHQVSIMIDGEAYDFSSHINPSKTANFEVTELP